MQKRKNKKSTEDLFRVAIGIMFLLVITLIAYEGTVLKMIEEWFIGLFMEKFQ